MSEEKKELTEKEAAEYMGWPVRTLRELAGRGWIKTTRSVGTPEGEEKRNYIELDPPPSVEFFFDEDDLRQAKEENERRKEDMRRKGYDDLHWFEGNAYTASVMASKTDESGTTYNHILFLFTGGYESEEEVQREALESARKDGSELSEAEGWTNHSVRIIKIDMLEARSVAENAFLFSRRQFGM
jgi:hypothetical protein